MATGYYSIYALSVYTVDAAIFLSVTTLEYPPSDPNISHRIYGAIEQATRRLEMAQERVSLARSGLQILQICYPKLQAFSRSQSHVPMNTVSLPDLVVNGISSDQSRIEDLPTHSLEDFTNIHKSH
ncbi:hypothetical protein N7490_008332 [Penicillium lividum]|nr:hypothetical protein N7490_008332 [Penicillium lividum]